MTTKQYWLEKPIDFIYVGPEQTITIFYIGPIKISRHGINGINEINEIAGKYGIRYAAKLEFPILPQFITSSDTSNKRLTLENRFYYLWKDEYDKLLKIIKPI